MDQAAMGAAITYGIDHGGWCPPGRTCENGNIREHFNLMETPVERSPHARHIPRSQRTEWNVRDAEGTLIMITEHCPTDSGTQWTIEVAEKLKKPWLRVDPTKSGSVERVDQWIKKNGISLLNVAGPSEANCTGIGSLTSDFFQRLFSQ